MTILQALLLGAVQGIAEFLPISSSGHLAVAEYFLGYAGIPIIFDILLHVATLGAVCIVFHKRIGRLLAVSGRFIIRRQTSDDSEDLKLIFALLISTAVTGGIGVMIKNLVILKNIRFIAAGFVITGIVLLVSGKIRRTAAQSVPSLFQAVIIGAAQGIGVLPGISRSGSTISAALLSGVDRERAGEYSFLLSIPAILAAFIFELKSARTVTASISLLPLTVGMITSFIVGLASLTFLLKVIKKGKLGMFGYYLIPAGGLLLTALTFFHM